MMNAFSLHGIIVPLLTPFDQQGAINQAATTALIDYLLHAGVHGLMVAGTTGEGELLTCDERQRLAEIVVQHVDGRVPVVIQAGTRSTAETMQLAQHARAIGADAAAVLCPYYFHYSDAALITHFCAVAASVPEFPLYLYNIPQRTGNSISLAVSAAVAERCANVVGEKDSSGDLHTMFNKRTIRNGRFDVLIGNDGLILPSLSMGVQGAVSGTANVVPELLVALFNAYSNDDIATARILQERVRAVQHALREGQELSLFKALVAKRGIAVGSVRAPLTSAFSAEVEQVVSQLHDLGVEL